VLKEFKETQVQLDQQVPKVYRALLGPQVPLVLHLMLLAQQVPQGLQGQQDLLVLLVTQVPQDQQDLLFLILHQSAHLMVMHGLIQQLVKHLSGMLMLMVDNGYKLVTL
jgi:hypothetical protein